jgi:hypothetical protein
MMNDGRANQSLEAALTVLADALAELPGKDIMFDWVRGGRLTEEVCEILEQRRPDKAAEMERAFDEWKRACRARKR